MFLNFAYIIRYFIIYFDVHDIHTLVSQAVLHLQKNHTGLSLAAINRNYFVYKYSPAGGWFLLPNCRKVNKI